MKRIKLSIFLLSISFLLSTACKEDVLEPISETPQIKSVEISPSNIKQFKDTLVFKINYLDGDGDLGEDDPDKNNIFISDSRLAPNFTHKFRLSRLKPGEDKVSIQGNIIVKLPNILITDNSENQNCKFTVYIMDRAGHKSNEFITNSINILK